MQGYDGRLAVNVCLSLLVIATVSSGTFAQPPPPGRIVSCSLASDEMLLDMIGPKYVVAVTTLARDSADSNCRELAKQVPHHLGQADAEAIMALNPDLVIVAPYNRPETIEALKQAHLNVLELRPYRTVNGIHFSLRMIGRRVGRPDRGDQMAAELDMRLYKIFRVYHQATKDRPMAALFSFDGASAGGETLFDDVLERAGGTNALARNGIFGYVTIDPERWLDLDPDWLIIAGDDAEPIRKRLNAHPLYSKLSAVKEDHLIVVPSRYLSSVSQYVVWAVELIARGLHPDLDWPPLELPTDAKAATSAPSTAPASDK